MAQLSPHYRNDHVELLDPGMQAYLDENYFLQLANRSVKHPKLLVAFSGGNGVGKSTLAARIGRECQALVLENDAVKRCLLAKYPELAANSDELNKLTWSYTMSLYPRLTGMTPNGLVVRDGIIHWYFDRILPIFEQQQYHLFIVDFDVSKARARELLKARGDTPTVKEHRFYRLLEDHRIHRQRFLQQYRPDITLTDENLFDHAQVISLLKQRLAELTD